ncbi:phenylacetate--CoA ligase family protein [Candidatus Nitrospira allomarina]|uniref:Phenylacetate--CoA ligase family protein n=1 Tax=Candidatus Nitrospira allomarina TaxID=3020900 RepID=A0AA96JSC8_9BACT|nr:hypothetical protein [Candidatus Nitrospira allomarina]WNM58123.1 hypothetical protein PP769_19470 [Candidatus Nitrospira allomarina]
MKEKLLRLYHRLPAPARSVAASLHGYYLRSWRYGPETERLIGEAIDREHWSLGQLRAWQEERLAHVLHRAATRVPYYREQWAERRRRGDSASWEYLENWPVLKKEALRQNPLSFVADDQNVRRMYREQTSGTSGTPLTLWWSRETVRTWFGLCEARLRQWNGVSIKDNWAILGGQSIVPPNASKPPFWVWNAPMNQLYLSANHISPKSVPAYIDALRRYGITHMIVYPSSASVLAREAYEKKLIIQGIKVVITNAEPLLPWQRDCISQGLGSEVRETYGMAEAVAAASECPDGKLHSWPEVGWLECFRDEIDEPALPGSSGRLLCTGLLNTDMPLIRYEVGDRISHVAEPSSCKCGRTLPVLSGIEGRTNDMLIALDGRRVFWVNPVFYNLPVQEAQIIQEGLDCLRVKYVPAANFSVEVEHAISARLQERMGRVKIFMDQVSNIPRGSNGKFRAVVCNLPIEKQ